MTFHPDVLAVHAQFGGDLGSMQALYDRPDHLATIERLSAELARAREVLRPFADLPVPERDGFTLYTRAEIEAARQFIEKEPQE